CAGTRLRQREDVDFSHLVVKKARRTAVMKGGYVMQRLRLIRWGLAALTTMSLTVSTTPAFAELKPGDKLDKSNCQEAKGMLPEHVMEKFCDGKFSAEIIEVK